MKGGRSSRRYRKQHRRNRVNISIAIVNSEPHLLTQSGCFFCIHFFPDEKAHLLPLNYPFLLLSRIKTKKIAFMSKQVPIPQSYLKRTEEYRRCFFIYSKLSDQSHSRLCCRSYPSLIISALLITHVLIREMLIPDEKII